MANEITIKGQSPSNTSGQIDYILLDDSGSMQSKWWESLDAIDSYLGSIRTAHLDTRVILSTFEHEWRDAAIAACTPMQQDPPGGMFGGTPLYDSINKLARRLREISPLQASIVIVTDGEENASSFTTQDQARALLDWMRLRGWQVSFIGCDFDNSRLANLLGGARAALGTSSKRLPEAMRLLADRRIHYGRTGEGIEFSDDERTKFGGYLGQG